MAKHIVRMTNDPDNMYVPNKITIHVNDQVAWINDAGPHNAAGTNGVSNFDTGDLPDDKHTESQPQTYTVLSTGPDGFKYSCTNHHPNMIGYVKVVPAGTDLKSSTRDIKSSKS
jgi:plastocyanin